MCDKLHLTAQSDPAALNIRSYSYLVPPLSPLKKCVKLGGGRGACARKPEMATYCNADLYTNKTWHWSAPWLELYHSSIQYAEYTVRLFFKNRVAGPIRFVYCQLCVYMYSHHIWASTGMVTNPDPTDQLNTFIFGFPLFPFAPLKIWSRQAGSTVPSRVSPLILHTQAESCGVVATLYRELSYQIVLCLLICV